MVLAFDQDKILHETNIRNVESRLGDAAMELAVLGKIDTARDLISLLHQKGARKSRSARALGWAWKMTGQWPEGTLEGDKSEEVFAGMRQEWEREYWGRRGEDGEESVGTFDLAGLENCLSTDGLEAYRFNDDPEHIAWVLNASTGSAAIQYSERLVKALDISVRLSDDTDVQQSQGGFQIDGRSRVILQMIVNRWGSNAQLDRLIMAERLWPLYLTGIVAQVAGVGTEELQTKADLIFHAFERRLSCNYAPTILAEKSTMEILEIANGNTLRVAQGPHDVGYNGFWTDDEDDPAEPTNESERTFLKDPAQESDIMELEARLGITLPDDYKEFLRCSNGFSDGEEGIFNGLYPDPALWSTREVKWRDDEYPKMPADILELPREIEDLGDLQPGSDIYTIPDLDRAVSVGDRDVACVWLVPPETVRRVRETYLTIYSRCDDAQKAVFERAVQGFAGSMEAFKDLQWCCVRELGGDADGMSSYPSFRRYLEVTTVGSYEEVDDE